MKVTLFLFFSQHAGELNAAKADDGFSAKLLAQVLQNLTITIEDVHFRYEDEMTNPDCPFAVGVSLKKLALESTDSCWTPRIVLEPSKQFFKLVSLESLSVYWISNADRRTALLRRQPGAEQTAQFRHGIATTRHRPYESCYIIGPITSYAKLRINSRPELDGSNYSIPKIFLNLTMQEICVGLTPQQYRDIILLLHSIERMSRASPYRKYRPPAVQSYQNHYRTWWRFAYTCVLEENVRRRRRNWQWSNIKAHRTLVRKYVALFKSKLSARKSEASVDKSIEECEELLDVFNITLGRRQAEVQVERLRTEQRTRQELDKKKGWFGGWFSNRSSSSSSDTGDDSAESISGVVSSLKAEMTADEKQKLYAAIGYEENAVPTTYPKDFVENRFEFFLKKLVILFHNGQDVHQPVILLSSLSRVEASIEQRPAVQGLAVSVKVVDFFIDGSPLPDETPRLVEPYDGNIWLLLLMLTLQLFARGLQLMIRVYEDLNLGT